MQYMCAAEDDVLGTGAGPRGVPALTFGYPPEPTLEKIRYKIPGDKEAASPKRISAKSVLSSSDHLSLPASDACGLSSEI